MVLRGGDKGAERIRNSGVPADNVVPGGQYSLEGLTRDDDCVRLDDRVSVSASEPEPEPVMCGPECEFCKGAVAAHQVDELPF